MSKMKTLLAGTAGAIVVGVIALAALYPGGAQASNSGSGALLPGGAAAQEAPADQPPGAPFHGHAPGMADGAFVTALAAQLGISEDELRTAMQAAGEQVLNDRLDQAVANGRLTQEQADQIREAHANGTVPAFLHQRAAERLADRLDHAVEAGRLTQDQADALLQAFEDGTLREQAEALGLPLRPRRFHHHRGGFGGGFGFGAPAQGAGPAGM